MIKVCSRCKTEKPILDFHKQLSAKDGYRSHCKPCRKASAQEYYKDNSERINLRTRAYDLKNRAKVAERAKRWATNNKDKCAAKSKRYAENNPEKVAARQREYKQNNKDIITAISAKRRAVKLRATPKWINDGYVKLFYKLAKIEEIRTGLKVHVDHIIPLNNPIVCGLHCEDNLQLLSEKANMLKGNRFEAGDPVQVVSE